MISSMRIPGWKDINAGFMGWLNRGAARPGLTTFCKKGIRYFEGALQVTACGATERSPVFIGLVGSWGWIPALLASGGMKFDWHFSMRRLGRLLKSESHFASQCAAWGGFWFFFGVGLVIGWGIPPSFVGRDEVRLSLFNAPLWRLLKSESHFTSRYKNS